jgi:hypothetical protein
MALPNDIPRNPDGSFVSLTWAEGGTATEPSAPRKDSGFLAGDVVTEPEINWLSRDPMRLARALESRSAMGAEGLYDSHLAVLTYTHGVWSTDAVGALEGFLSDAPTGVNSIVSDVWVNPSGATGAVRMQVSVPKASPATFVASRSNYVYVTVSPIAPPTNTLADLTILDVPLGDPAPAAPANTVAVWRVDTNGVTITAQQVQVPSIPVFLDIGVMGDLLVQGTLDVFADIDMNNTDLLNCNEADIATLVVGAGGIESITATNNLGTVTADSVSASTLTVPFVFTAEDTVGSVTVEVPSTFNGDINVDSAANVIANGNLSVFGDTLLDQALEVNGAADFTDTVVCSGPSVSTGIATPATFNAETTVNARLNITSRLTLNSTSLLAARDLGPDASDNLRYRDASATKFVHYNSSGWVWGIGRADTLGAAAATLSLNTANAVAPLAAVDVIVEASALVSRAIAGLVTISLIEVGVGTLGVTRTVAVPATGGSNYMLCSISRTRTLMPTSPTRTFQFSIDGGGSNVTAVEGIIKVYPAT